MPEVSAVRTINISFATLFKVVAAVALLYFLYQILDVLALVFVAIILATALAPLVDWLEHNRIPRPLAVLIIYAVMLFVFSITLVLLLPPLAQELVGLAQSLPSYYGKAVSSLSGVGGGAFHDEASATIQRTIQQLGVQLASSTTSILSALADIFGGMMQFVIALVMTYYLAVNQQGMKRLARSLVPERHQAYATELINRIQTKLGGWLRGQLLLMLIIGVLDYLGLVLLGMDYALVLGLWAGLTELVPYVGPVLGAIPGVFLAFTMSPVKALWVLGLYVLVQQLENQIIVPVVMRKSVGLNPIVSIVAVIVGARLGGVLGAIMAIPVATAAAVALSDFFASRNQPASVGLGEGENQGTA